MQALSKQGLGKLLLFLFFDYSPRGNQILASTTRCIVAEPGIHWRGGSHIGWVPYYLRGCRWRTCHFCTHSAAYLLPGLLCELHFWQFRAPSDLNARQYARNVLSQVVQEALEQSYNEATIVCLHLFPTVQERYRNAGEKGRQRERVC